MAMYQNMLVVIDPNQDDQPALRRAVYLHQRIGGKIKAFLPIYDFSYEMTTLLSPDERTAMRQGVISQRTAGYVSRRNIILKPVSPLKLKWSGTIVPLRPSSGGYRRQSRSGVKNGASARSTGSGHFTPTDWHLLRKCPSPVWMVKDQPWPEGGKATVAVNWQAKSPITMLSTKSW